MKVVKLIVCIESINTQYIQCLITNSNIKLRLKYFVDEGRVNFIDENDLAETIRSNQLQFDKVIRSSIKGDLVVGQSIHCVFIEDFPLVKEADFNSIIRVDRRNGKLEIIVSIDEALNIHRIYADGSYNCKTKQSGYGGFIENPIGEQEIFHRSFKKGSSNLMELLGVTEGLQRLNAINTIQVNTDSRFVIRGLVQWVHFWKHNNWQTAFGCDVKFTEQWQQAYELCENKLVEFKWIKGHSGNEKQDFCHQLARESTKTSI